MKRGVASFNTWIGTSPFLDSGKVAIVSAICYTPVCYGSSLVTDLGGNNMRMIRHVITNVKQLLPPFLLAIVCCQGSIYGQAAIILDQPVTIPISALTVGDVDFTHATVPKLLFSVSMRTQDGSTTVAKMTITLDIMPTNGEPVLSNAIQLETRPPHITINGSRTITNLDLGKTIPVDVQVNSDARKKLEETALPSGLVPSGTYKFTVNVTPVLAGTGDTKSFSIYLTNPSSIGLLSPADGDQYVNEFPLFQWQFDGTQSTISIFEKLPSQSSLEEAASGVPQLSATVATTSFQYPGAGARKLQSGGTYVWFVEGLVGTAGGTPIVYKSALRSFKVTTGAPLSPSNVLDELERVLGPNRKALFDQIRAEALSPTGVIRVGGSTISNVDLVKLLSFFRAHPDAVTNAGLE